ncbi:MAG: hypothetical protein RMJ98_05730, partial [Myxococcales bacterium]|nr:hypothetical protein [Polyangiaceae bacterium]MDW8248792.1 hypothetical protein [Myxococcales bacterium]
MMHPSPPRLLQWLGRMQASRPWTVLLLALLTMIPAGWGASGLTLKPDFAELLPDGKESVIEMRRVSERLPGSSTLSLYIQTKTSNPAALEAFVDEVAPKLQALGPEWVGSVDAGVKESQRFFEKHKLLYADYEALKKAHAEILERYDYEVAKASGTLLDEGDVPPPITAESIKQRLQGEKKEDPKAG